MAEEPLPTIDAKSASMWDEHANALLREWRQRVAAASEAHYNLASALRRYNTRLGVPVVLLSSAVGTTLFATLTDPNQSTKWWITIAAGSVSVVAAALSA